MYAVIVENDVSQWSDATGTLYHFPKRYLKYLQPGTKVIYYKGRIKERKYQETRLSNDPHYFGLGVIQQCYCDPKSTKNDYFGSITNFERFVQPIMAKIDGDYLEMIPENLANNYWRNGVRPISHDSYEFILSHLSKEGTIEVQDDDGATHEHSEAEEELESHHEGERSKKYVTVYERNPRLRKLAIAIHGSTCHACGFNYEATYGEWGENYIHIHHMVPVSEFGESKSVDPKTDLVPLCANCHSMVHRRKDKTLTVDELKQLLFSAQV